MDYISGNIGQNHTTDLGPFLTIGNVRFRKDSVLFYTPSHWPDDHIEKMKTDNCKIPYFKYGIHMQLVGHVVGIPISDNYDDVLKEVERLDWIFKKDLKESVE